MSNEPSPLPATGWISQFQLGAPLWPRASEPGAAEATRLATQNTPGELAVAGELPEWIFKISMPDVYNRSEISMLCCGFQIVPEGRPAWGIQACCPADGVLVGTLPPEVHYEVEEVDDAGRSTRQEQRFTVQAELFSPGLDIQVPEPGVYLAQGSRPAALVQDAEGRFALAFGGAAVEVLLERARHFLATDPSTALAEAAAVRRAVFETEVSPAAQFAVEVLAGALRGPEGRFRHAWSASPLDGGSGLAVNDAFCIIPAWAQIDVAVARELLRGLVSTGQDQGRLPAEVRLDGQASEARAWPLLAHTLAVLHDQHPDPGFLAELLPGVLALQQDALAGFAPDGMPAWREDEALVPDLWDEGLCAPDLAALLLNEIDQLRRLAAACPELNLSLDEFQTARTRLALALDGLWHEERKVYLDRYANGEQIRRKSLSSYLPLLWKELPEDLAAHLLLDLDAPQSLMGAQGLSAWERWESDETAPGIDARHQALGLSLFNRAGGSRLLDQLSLRSRSFLESTYSEQGRLPATWPVEGAQLDPLDARGPAQPVAAALLLQLYGPARPEHSVYSQYPRYVVWLEKRRHLIMTVLGALTLLFTTLVILLARDDQEIFGSHATAATGLVNHIYRVGDYDRAIALLEALIPRIRSEHAQAVYKAQLANAYFRNEDYAQAETLYREIADNKDESLQARARFNLSQSLYRQGRSDEAIVAIDELLARFGEKMPPLKTRAEQARNLIRSELAQHQE